MTEWRIPLEVLVEALVTGETVKGHEAAAGAEAGSEDEVAHAVVQAGDLRKVLLGLEGAVDPRGRDPKGLSVQGVRVSGKLDLTGGTIEVPFEATECLFDEMLILEGAKGISIALSGSTVRGVEADSLQLDRDLLLDKGFYAIEGVWLAGCRLGGQLNCEDGYFSANDGGEALTAFFARIGFGVLLANADAGGPVNLSMAEIGKAINLSGARFSCGVEGEWPALDLRSAKVAGEILVEGKAVVDGRCDMSGAIVDRLYCAHLVIRNALAATRVRCSGDMMFDRLEVEGQVSLDDSEIGGFYVTFGSLTAANAIALYGVRLRTASSLTLGAGLTVSELSLAGAVIAGDLTVDAQMAGTTGKVACDLAGTAVEGSVTIRSSAKCQGGAKLTGMRIGKDLLIATAWNNPGSTVLEARGLVAGGDVRLSSAEKRSLVGAADFTRSDIAGDLTLAGDLDAQGFQYDLTGVHIAGTLSAEEDARLNGTLNLAYARIGGNVDLDGFHCGDIGPSPNAATVTDDGGDPVQETPGTAPSDPRFWALLLGQASIDESLHLGDRFLASGGVDMFFAEVGAVVNLRKGLFTRRVDKDAIPGMAVSAEGLRAQSLVADGGMFEGAVRLTDARIERINITGAELDGKESGTALECPRMSVSGPAYLCPASVTGGIDLSYASARILRANKTLLSARPRVLGFAYDAVEGKNNELKAQDWREMLPRGEDFAAQPYLQLAEVHRAAGRDDEARRVLIELRSEQGKRVTAGRWAFWHGLWDRLLRATVGFGYYPLRSLWSIVGIAVVGWLIFALAYPRNLVATGDQSPGFNPLMYSLDTLLPIINFGQQDAWTPYSYAQWWAWFSIAAGWLLSTALVSGITRVLRG